jgi:asparagine synthase (glutamine-hydrolysing)
VAILLSGGLDSSSVLANLVNFKPAKDIVCINLFSSDADLDERAYARAACEHLGVKLHELAFEDTDVNAGGQESQYRTARPNGRSLVSVLDKKILRVASDAGCNSIWSGNAGDAVLYQNLSPELIGDLYIDRGLCSALRYAGSIASFKNRTLWGILAEAYKSVDRKAIEGKVEIPLDDLTESILTNVPDTDGSIFSHAVPAGFNDVERPGKAEHIVSIYRSAYDSQELFLAPEYAPFNVVNPFVSQPLLEWAVRIPVYRFYGKEGTRAPLRKILSRSLPKRVAFRNIKGEGGGPVMRYITRSSDKVLARLSNGALTQQQILNIAAVQKLLEDQTKIANGNLVELIGPLAVEAWRSSWSEVRNG